MSWLENNEENLHFGELRAKRRGSGGYSVMAFENFGLDTDMVSHQGVVRLPFADSSEYFAAMSFTSADAWYVDLGVPVIVSRSVYNSFNRIRIKSYAVETSFTASVHFRSNPLMKSEFVSSLNSVINKDFVQRIIQSTHLPEPHLRIISPIDIKLRSNNTHPPGDLWVYAQFVNRKSEIGRLLFFRSTCSLHERDEIETICEGFRKGYGEKTIFSDLLLEEMKTPIPFQEGYMQVHTEFDSRVRRFSTSIPISPNPWNEKNNKETIVRLMKLLETYWRNTDNKK